MRGFFLAFLATFGGCLCFYTLPDAIAAALGRVMPYWFYEGQVGRAAPRMPAVMARVCCRCAAAVRCHNALLVLRGAGGARCAALRCACQLPWRAWRLCAAAVRCALS